MRPFGLALSFGLPSLAVGVLGVTPTAAALAGSSAPLYAVIQHAHVRTAQVRGSRVYGP